MSGGIITGYISLIDDDYRSNDNNNPKSIDDILSRYRTWIRVLGDESLSAYIVNSGSTPVFKEASRNFLDVVLDVKDCLDHKQASVIEDVDHQANIVNIPFKIQLPKNLPNSIDGNVFLGSVYTCSNIGLLGPSSSSEHIAIASSNIIFDSSSTGISYKLRVWVQPNTVNSASHNSGMTPVGPAPTLERSNSSLNSLLSSGSISTTPAVDLEEVTTIEEDGYNSLTPARSFSCTPNSMMSATMLLSNNALQDKVAQVPLEVVETVEDEAILSGANTGVASKCIPSASALMFLGSALATGPSVQLSLGLDRLVNYLDSAFPIIVSLDNPSSRACTHMQARLRRSCSLGNMSGSATSLNGTKWDSIVWEMRLPESSVQSGSCLHDKMFWITLPTANKAVQLASSNAAASAASFLHVSYELQLEAYFASSSSTNSLSLNVAIPVYLAPAAAVESHPFLISNSSAGVFGRTPAVDLPAKSPDLMSTMMDLSMSKVVSDLEAAAKSFTDNECSNYADAEEATSTTSTTNTLTASTTNSIEDCESSALDSLHSSLGNIHLDPEVAKS